MTEIKLRFAFPRWAEDHILKALGRAVKDFRAELKAMYYEPNKHNRTSLVNANPPRVPRDQWLKLISYWDQEKTKRRPAVNKINQKNQTMPHCAGRESFAQLRARKTVDGVEPSRAHIFLDTHKDRKSRDKKKIDDESAKAAELMKQKLQELPNGIEKMNEKIAWKGDIFDQVIGKEERHGRVRGVGGGVSSTILWGNSHNYDASETSNYFDNNEGSNELVRNLQNNIKVMEDKHSEEIQRLKLREEKRDLELKQMSENQRRLESHIYELVYLFTQRAATKNTKNASNDIDSGNLSG